MLFFQILLAIGLMGSHPSALAWSCQHTDTEFHCVEYEKNYDGDTITVNIPEVHQLLGRQITVRILGIDAPERKSDDPCERNMAMKAQREVERLLSQARRIDLVNVQRDKYFRVLAEVYADDISVGKVLLKKGFAVPYDGGTKSKVDWCN